MLELRPLIHFVRIAEAGSLQKAAIGLDLSPSILSREVQELERVLGYRVFFRTGRGVRLTDLGQQLYPRVKEFLLDANRLSDEARALRGEPSGVVRVGLPESVGAILAGPLYKAVEARYPKVFLRITEGLSGLVDELLTLGRIDIGLFFTETPNARRGALPLCEVELVLVGARGDPLTARGTVRLKQLNHLPLILPSFPHALRRRIEEVWSAHHLDLFVPLEADSLLTRKEAVAAGVGYTVAPYDAVAMDASTQRVQVARITYPTIKRHLVLASTGKGLLTLAARSIASLVPQLVGQLIRDGRWTGRLP